MKAVTWHGVEDVRVVDVPDPRLEDSTDAIIRVTSSAICGSDLHMYGLLGMFMQEGDILGHEAIGVVEEVGSDVEHIEPGDRVVVPFTISCGRCHLCRRHLYAHCETTQVREHGKGAQIFGYTKLYGGVPGAQAEYLRVPYANFGPIQVPDDHPDERYLYLSDVLPTAWQAVEYAHVPVGGSLAVFGLGPVGQFCVRVARHRGVDRVLGVDLEPARLALAERYGAETVDTTAVDDVVEVLRDATDGRGPDAVIDAVGMEAHGAPVASLVQRAAGMLPDGAAAELTQLAGVDRLSVLHEAIRTVRRGGTVSVSGVYVGAIDPLPMMEMFDKGIQMRMGQANVRRWAVDLLPLVINEDRLGTEDLASHHLPLAQAPRGYEMFQKKEDDAIKIVLGT